MAFDLALFDLISSYALLGDSFGAWHAALSVMFVDEHSVATDETGIVISGVARFSGEVHPFVDPSTMTFGVQAENTEGHPSNDDGRRDPWFDIRDAHIEFQLSAPRVASQKVVAAVGAIGGAPAFAPSAAVLAALDATPAVSSPSDYPDTEFTLDLLLTTIVLRPPFLRPAQLLPNGQLVEDTTKTSVKISLPRIKIRLAQGSGVVAPLTVELLSLGASSLDATEDIGVAQLVTMEPPYAFIGPSKVVGFGFRSATLDLSDNSTPPDVLAQFGFDESWTGLYLPEIRLFIAPHGADDFAVDAGARNLLIGFGASAGITGDFDLEVINQGSGKLTLGARFYDDAGQSFAITRTDDTHATVTLPPHTWLIVDVNGGLTPYNASVGFDGAAPTAGRVFECDLSSANPRTILISVTDSRPTPLTATLTAVANRLPASLPAPPGTALPAGSAPAQIETLSATRGGLEVGAPRLTLSGETPATATVKLATDVPTNARWTVGGVDKGTSLTVQVDLAAGASVPVSAEVPGAAATDHFEAFFRFDQPPARTSDGRLSTDDGTRAFAQIEDNPPSTTRSTNTSHAADEGLTAPWPEGTSAGSGIAPLLANLPAGTAITIHGFSSFEAPGADKLVYNTALARRRALGLQAIIAAHQGAKNFAFPDTAADMTHWNAAEQGGGAGQRSLFWKAIASWPAQPIPGTITTGRVFRDAPTPIVPAPLPDNPTTTAATQPPPPDWFKEVGAKVRIVQNQFVACEVFGKFDIQTSSERMLRQGGVSDANMPALRRLGSNPSDGIIDLRVVVQIDDATDIVTVSGYFGADPADKDGLMMTGSLPGEALAPRNLGRNYLGMAIAFMPLLSAAASAVAGDGALAEIGVTAATLALPFTLGSLPFLNVERVIWYGGELTVQVRPDGTQVVALFDFETAISANIADLITIPPEAPLVVRYKAIGLLLGNPPGQPKFQARPMFDASKGYTIDVSRPGAIQVAQPLGQILKVLGARIARNNPLILEIDLGFAIDLGVVSIDRARVRLKLDPPGIPELTAFGAGIDIPGAIQGRGYLELNQNEIKGQIDLTIVPVQVRIAAGVGIAHIDPDKTAVIVTLSVEFPVAIPLATSGLGIYGFLGLFAMNYARNEQDFAGGSVTPALAWLKATGGNPTDIAFWKPKADTWAFGVGAILGTMGSSVIFNLKGVVLLELPGPRLLLMMKAKVLAVIPELKGNAEGNFLAVIDLDFGRGTLTVGLSILFDIDPLLKISIPVEAFFDFNHTEKWRLFVGRYLDQVQAKVLQVFDASGYLMLSGDGLSGIGSLPAVTGFSIATGLHVSFTWGGGPLFARLSAGFDAIIGFSPFRLAGTLTVRGTLHLFIIDISAWADLHVDIGEDGAGNKTSHIWGDICGEVHFFFFSVKGCVSFSLGPDNVPPAPLPNLVASLKLISRSPALVLGTGVDKPIDSGIGDAVGGDPKDGDTPPPDPTTPPDPHDPSQPRQWPVVPIDAIPSLLMAMPPLQDPALKFLGQPIGGTPEAPADGWVQRGDTWYQYSLKSVELVTGGVTTGQTPATWWKPKTGKAALEAQLALLSWVPDATPKALGSSKYLDEMIAEQWGTVCQPAAPATSIFWTFLRSNLGVSASGWNLNGIALPDPPGTISSTPPDTAIHVSERWRSGDALADQLRGIVAAQVEGSAVACPDRDPFGNPDGPRNPLGNANRGGVFAGINPITAIRGGESLETTSLQSLTLSDALASFASGEAVGRADLLNLSLSDTRAASNGQGGCFARVLASPVLDNGEPVAFGNPTRKDLVAAGWEKAKFRPGPLDDAVVFETGAFEFARFYLWIPERLLRSGAIVVAASDGDDNFFDQHIVTSDDLLPPLSFPPAWNDASSPWHRSVVLVTEMLPTRKGYVGVFVQIKGGAKADRVQIGATRESRRIRQTITARPFYVAAFEARRTAEVQRFDYDDSQQTIKQGTLEKALGLDSADNALLLADQTYQIRVTWNVNIQKPAPDTHPSGGTPGADIKQSFWFRTDNAPPARLDPYVLVGLPGEGEKHFFASEPVRVVFASNNLVLLFDAYGKKLQARLRPASFRPVEPPPGVKHPHPLDSTTLVPVKAAILSPWEDAVQSAIQGSCVPVKGERVRHSMVTIPIPLDLYTDYLLDIEMLDKSAPDGSPGTRIWRETFTTGGFRSLEEFAQSFQIVRVGHRGVHSADNGKLQAIGTNFASRAPQGHEFDTALQNAGLDALPVPKAPQALVFWESSGGAPQPVAILLDASEPMQRSRPIPTEIFDSTLAAAKHFEMVDTRWLDIAQAAGGDDIVDKIVVAPGGQRALITLKNGARDKHLKLAFKRIAQTAPYLDGAAATDSFVPVLDVQLANAPWEEIN